MSAYASGGEIANWSFSLLLSAYLFEDKICSTVLVTAFANVVDFILLLCTLLKIHPLFHGKSWIVKNCTDSTPRNGKSLIYLFIFLQCVCTNGFQDYSNTFLSQYDFDLRLFPALSRWINWTLLGSLAFKLLTIDITHSIIPFFSLGTPLNVSC
jgi:hypothetical protein